MDMAGFAKMRRALIPDFVFFAAGFEQAFLEDSGDLPVLAVHADNRRRTQFGDCFNAEIDRAVVVTEIALTFAVRPVSRRALLMHQMHLILERSDTVLSRH